MGVRYFMGTRTSGNHWSAIYRDTPFGEPSFSTLNGDFTNKIQSGPVAFRIRGVQGCGSVLKADLRCPVGGGRATLIASGGTPNGPVGVVASTNNSGFIIPIGSCTGTVIATRPPFLPGTPINGNFDGSGNFTASANVPAGLCTRISVSVVDLTTCDVVDLP